MNIYDEIKAERVRQDSLWGGAEHDGHHGAGDWADFIIQRADKLRDFQTPERIAELFVHIAALAVAALESIDRGDCQCVHVIEGEQGPELQHNPDCPYVRDFSIVDGQLHDFLKDATPPSYCASCGQKSTSPHLAGCDQVGIQYPCGCQTCAYHRAKGW